MLALRPYQSDAIEGVWRFFREGRGNPLVVLPTGAGKSLVLSHLAKDAIEQFPSTRILIVQHVRELLTQNFEEMMRLWPEAPAGVYSAALGKRQANAQVLFCSIQSVAKKVGLIGYCDLMIVDEAHLIPRKSETQYASFIADLTKINPHMKVIGLTATPFRMDSGMLHKGGNALFDGIAHDAGVADLIDNDYLSPVTTLRTTTQIDTTGVKKRGGEFVPSLLEAAVNLDPVNRAIVDETIAAADGRKGWLIFASGVSHAEDLATAFREKGVSCGVVHGGCTNREELIRMFKARELTALASMNILTTGFNAPHVDLIVMARPTESTGLYVQMVGRGLRKAPGKENCLVLDFAMNIERHGPIDDLLVNEKGEGGDGEAPSKDCSECGEQCHAAARVCPACGSPFPEPEVGKNLAERASKAAILARERALVPPEWVTVKSTKYVRHEKMGKPPSMRVEYEHGLTMTRDWVCFEHIGRARREAEAWWRRGGGDAPYPTTTEEAIRRCNEGEVSPPFSIAVRLNGKFREIVDQNFSDAGESKDLMEVLDRAKHDERNPPPVGP